MKLIGVCPPFPLIFLIFSSFCCFSCSGPEKNTSPAPPSSSSTLSDPSFSDPITSMLLSPELAKFIRIQDQTVSRNRKNIFLAETLILNDASTPKFIEMRGIFKNQAGHTLEVSPWKPFTLSPKKRTICTLSSSNTFSSRCLVQIRLPSPKETSLR